MKMREPIIPKTHAFPMETVEHIYRSVIKTYNDYRKEKPYAYALGLYDSYQKEQIYGFSSNLETGIFAQYHHEAIKNLMFNYNCTTIIPQIYLIAEADGFQPQIVQFLDFKEYATKKKKKEKLFSSSHYSLIIDIGRKHNFLLDPVYNTFGQILSIDDHLMRIGKSSKSSAVEREYRKLLYYSAEEFAQMMQRLKEPAESLDMLVAGQRVIKKDFLDAKASTLNLYYSDKSNELTTRLYLDQIGISDKAIYYHQKFSDKAKIISSFFEFCYAKDESWDNLQGQEKIAKITKKEFFQLVSLLCHAQVKKNKPILDTINAHPQQRSDLLSLVEKFWNDLSLDEQQTINNKVYARTLYEYALQDKKYLYTAEMHDEKIQSLLKEFYIIDDEKKHLERILYQNKQRLIQLSKQEISKINKKLRNPRKQHKKVDDEYEDLLRLRNNFKSKYSQMMDFVLYSQTLNASTLEQHVKEQNYDSKIGYLAIINDFIPYVHASKEDLFLKRYMLKLQKKIIARMVKENFVKLS